MCVRSEGFGGGIHESTARGDEDFSNTVEANRNFETIRGRSMAIRVLGKWDGGAWVLLRCRRVTSYPPLTNSPNHQGRRWRGLLVAMAVLHIFLLSVFIAILLVLVRSLATSQLNSRIY